MVGRRLRGESAAIVLLGLLVVGAPFASMYTVNAISPPWALVAVAVWAFFLYALFQLCMRAFSRSLDVAEARGHWEACGGPQAVDHHGRLRP